MNRIEKVIKGLECCSVSIITCEKCDACPYGEQEEGEIICHEDNLLKNSLSILKAQNEVIAELRKVGYPHDFQDEKPWIVDYMNLITEVIKKAMRLSNG